MQTKPPSDLIRRKYQEVFGAAFRPSFESWMHAGNGEGAALGYCRAGAQPLYLEGYLDCPIEDMVSAALGRQVERNSIIEIGNLAADSAPGMVELWGQAANDLGGNGEVAVATLTAKVRRMFARIGLPVTVLAPARPERLGTGAAQWGSYYESDPMVCMGVIAEGQAALSAFLARRSRKAAA
ncbi:MAG: thermostable hemolysin [Novosphingobium sp.]|nr:thermostable hemolysin [Novosphingobium sp.]